MECLRSYFITLNEMQSYRLQLTRSYYPDNVVLDKVVVDFAEVVAEVVLFADELSVEVDSAEDSEEVVGSAVEEELEAELLESELKLKESRLATVLQEMELVMSLVELQAVNFVPLLTNARMVFSSTMRYCRRIFFDARPITNFLPVSQPSTPVIFARSIYSQESPFKFALPFFGNLSNFLSTFCIFLFLPCFVSFLPFCFFCDFLHFLPFLHFSFSFL